MTRVRTCCLNLGYCAAFPSKASGMSIGILGAVAPTVAAGAPEPDPDPDIVGRGIYGTRDIGVSGDEEEADKEDESARAGGTMRPRRGPRDRMGWMFDKVET